MKPVLKRSVARSSDVTPRVGRGLSAPPTKWAVPSAVIGRRPETAAASFFFDWKICSFFCLLLFFFRRRLSRHLNDGIGQMELGEW